MFRRILLPVDPARSFDAATQYAVDLAHRFGSSVTTTYVIDEHRIGHVGAEATSYLDDALEWVGRDAMEDFAKAHEDLEVSKTLCYGNTPTALFQMVLQTGADLVVLGGYHVARGSKLWGSTAVDIVHHAERPTFVVRSGRLPKAGEAIVVPFDGSDRPVANLRRITRLAAELDATLDMVYVAGRGEQERAEAIVQKGAYLAEQEGVKADTHVLSAGLLKTKPGAILDHARRTKSPLIAISRLGAKSRHTGHSRTVDRLVSHADVPVWVVRK